MSSSRHRLASSLSPTRVRAVSLSHSLSRPKALRSTSCTGWLQWSVVETRQCCFFVVLQILSHVSSLQFHRRTVMSLSGRRVRRRVSSVRARACTLPALDDIAACSGSYSTKHTRWSQRQDAIIAFVVVVIRMGRAVDQSRRSCRALISPPRRGACRSVVFAYFCMGCSQWSVVELWFGAQYGRSRLGCAAASLRCFRRTLGLCSFSLMSLSGRRARRRILSVRAPACSAG